MKKVMFLCWVFLIAKQVRATEPPPTTTDAVHFIENKGQWDERVTHRVRVPNGNLYFHQGGFTYDFLDEEIFHHHHEDEPTSKKAGVILPNEPEIPLATQQRATQQAPEFTTVNAHALRVMFQQHQATYRVVGKNLSSAYYNFYYGDDEKKWVSQARAYTGIMYEGIYEGIDFQMRQWGEGLKYEFFIAPHANPTQIRMLYEGADKLYLENGQLKVVTSVMTIVEHKPVAFQRIGNDTVYVACRFKLRKNELSFEFPEGFRSEYPLVIDPVLTFSTYSGSFADNWGFTATYDAEGNLYAGGIVMDNRLFPITSGAYQAVFRGGIADVSIIKYNKVGTNIIYATYLGGSNVEVPTSMIVNSKNELIVLGVTGSNNFPVTTTAPFPFFQGGSDITPIGGIQYNNGSDLFISRFSNDGTALLGSTYLGGSGNDGINTPNSYVQGNNFQIVLNLNYGDEFKGEVVVDNTDNIYIASCTYSTNFPANGFKITNSGNEEGVVVKFNATLSTLIWSTYVGGTFSDAAYSLRVHNSRVYVVGATRSNNMDMGGSGFDKTFNGGIIDGFAYVLNANTSSLLASTYLGTDQIDEAYHVDIDNEGNPIIAGLTFGNYPITSGVYNNPSSGQFIHGLNPSLVTTLFSTRIGANTTRPAISITAFSVDKCGNIYLAGWGGATNASHIGGSTSGMPITSNAIQASTDGSDFYIAMFSKNATRLLYGTFLGHISSSPLQEHVDGGTSRFSPEGIVYQSVCSCGTTAFPTTPGVWSNFNRATLIGDPTVLRCNIASFKFELEKLKSSFTVSQATGCAPLTINFRSTSENAIKLTWDMGDGTTFTNLTSFNYTYSQPGTYIVKLTAESDFICTPDVFQQTITIHPRNNMSVSASSFTLCEGETAQLQATGGVFYQWSPATGLSNPNIANPIANPTQSTDYQVLVRNSFGCDTLIKVSVRRVPRITNDFTFSVKPCVADTISNVVIRNNSQGGTAYVFNMGNGQTVRVTNGQASFSYKYASPGTYTITVTTEVPSDIDKCKPNPVSKQVTINPPTNFRVAQNEYKLCQGQTAQLNASGGIFYQWTPATGLSNPNIPNPIANPAQTTNYNVLIRNQNGCDTTLTVRVIRLERITNDFTFSVKPCHPNTIPPVQITNNSEGANAYVFNLGDGRTYRTTNPREVFSHQYAQPGTYTISIESEVDAANLVCKPPIVRKTITINPPTNFAVNRTEFTLCDGQTAQLQASGGTTYQWTPATGLDNPTIPNPIANPVQTTTYQVRIATSFGCDTTIQVRVVRLPKITTDFSFSTVACSKDTIASVRFQNLSEGAPSYTFNMGDGRTVTVAAGQQEFSYKYAQAGTYTVTLTANVSSENAICAPAPLQKQVIVNPPTNFQFLVPSEVTLCDGETIQLNASGAIRYTWSPAEGLSNPNISNPIANPTQTTTYTLTMENANGCTATFSTLLRRIPKISADFRVEVTGCGEVTITNLSEGATSYLFDMGDGRTVRQTDGRATFRYQYAQRNVYTIRLTTEVGEEAKKCQPNVVQKTINVQPPSAFAVKQTEFSLCEGEVAQLEASGGIEYRWTPATGLSNPNIPNPVANPPTTTVYQVFIRNSFNCDTTIRVSVERVLPIVADFNVLFKEVCDTVPLLVIQNRSQNGKTYEFSFANGQKVSVSEDNASFEVKLPSGKQVVTLKATHTNPKCRQEKILEKEITVPYDRSALFEEASVPTKVDVCLGYTATITATGGVRYEWSPATGLDNPTNATVNLTPTQDMTYTVRIFNEKGCFVEKNVPITIFPEIVLEYEYQLSTPCGEYPILKITKNQSRGATQYVWRVGEQTFPNQLPANYQFSTEGRIPLTLRGENSACYEEKTVYIDVKRVIPPNVFTPNGDGFNDFFEIPSSKRGWKIEIFNRWGERVYQSDDYQNNWDGRDLSDTEFYYLITSPEGDTCRGFFRKL